MEFLLENPFILVVLIGIISSFYKQMKGTGEDDRQKRKQPKPFLPGQSAEKSKPFFDFGEIQKRLELPQVERKIPDEKQVLITNSAQETKSVAKTRQSNTGKKAERQTTGRLNQPRLESPVKNEKEFLVSNQTLRDAVVWAEILGPPRAKKAHHRKRTNSHY